MDSILVWTVLIGVLFLVGLLVFLLDRLQTISNLARFGPPEAYLAKVKKRQQQKLIANARSSQKRNSIAKDGDSQNKGLGGGQDNTGDKPAKKPLEGRVLWNILAGKRATKRSEEEIEAIRKEYKIGLTKHLSSLFEDGVSDSKEGKNEPPGNVKTIEHAGGEFLSWIPQRYAGELYELGRTAAVDRTEGFILVRRELEGVCSFLFNEVGLDEGKTGNKLATELLSNVQQEEANKPKKTPVSTEVMDMLDSDNSYDDKVALVRVFSSTDLERIAKVVKGMIKT